MADGFAENDHQGFAQSGSLGFVPRFCLLQILLSLGSYDNKPIHTGLMA